MNMLLFNKWCIGACVSLQTASSVRGALCTSKSAGVLSSPVFPKAVIDTNTVL